jgi:diguanylate cyclase (GGDEF)-like protein
LTAPDDGRFAAAATNKVDCLAISVTYVRQSVESPTPSRTSASLLRDGAPAVLVSMQGCVRQLRGPMSADKTNASLSQSLEPYGQLIRMLMPRALSVDFFGPDGTPQWSSSTLTSTNLPALVADARRGTGGTEEGLFGKLDDGTPVYLFRLCDESGALLAVVSVTTRADAQDARPWSFVHSLLRPALEILQRELAARASIGQLSQSLEVRDKDLDLLVAITSDAPSGTDDAVDGDTDELRWIVQRSIEHLGCLFGALVIPEKGIAICRAAPGTAASQSTEVLTRTHRHLLTWAQLQGRTLVVNKVSAGSNAAALPYKILSSPLRQSSSRVVGFFALFRTENMADFDHRQTRIARLLARKIATVVQANYDSATGLLTRAAFERHAEAALKHAAGDSHCVVYVDIDQLHEINENYGMHIGDAVIARIGELARRTAHPRAVSARISGDRFALLLPDCELEQAAAVARTLGEGARNLQKDAGESSPEVSLSIGVAPLRGSEAKLDHALAAAEVACKAAKDRGRARVEVFQEADESIIRRHTDINVAVQLREALRTGRFRLDLQPILPLQGGHKEPHFELLLRMVADDGHSIAPEKFLSAAARYQLMPAIDRWVIENAIALLAENAALLRQHAARFTINIAGPSLAQPDFGDFVEGAVRGSGLPSDSFCFELTETAAVAHMGRAEVFMRRLRDFGCQFALDDFGTGFSSLAYLKALPVSMLKIDGSFVRDVLIDARSQSMVRAIAQLARTMCMETVAEYVETDEIRRRVAALGVDYGQGFCLGKPQPVVDVLKELPVFVALARSAQHEVPGDSPGASGLTH